MPSVPPRQARTWTRAALPLAALTLGALPACDALDPAPPASPAFAAVDGASLRAYPGGALTAASGPGGALLARTGGATRFDVAFLPPTLLPGRPLAVYFEGASSRSVPPLALLSRPLPGGRAEVTLDLGPRRPRSVAVEARYGGRRVALVEQGPGLSGAVSGGTTHVEPTSVHYYRTCNSNGECVTGVEYDYRLHAGGGTTVELAGGAGPILADRLRFILRGGDPTGPVEAVRFQGFERLSILPSSAL